MKCKLCNEDNVSIYYKDTLRQYAHCTNCDLIFVPEDHYIEIEREIERYELHDNTFQNTGYVNYLRQLENILVKFSDKSNKILDFGCGKNAVLSKLLQEQGLSCDSYDPLFGMDLALKKDTYDIIVMCEVIEHIKNIKTEMKTIDNILKSNGKIILRTQLFQDLDMFKSWWYKQDITHINFFSRKAIENFGLLYNYRIDGTELSDTFLMSRKTN